MHNILKRKKEGRAKVNIYLRGISKANIELIENSLKDWISFNQKENEVYKIEEISESSTICSESIVFCSIDFLDDADQSWIDNLLRKNPFVTCVLILKTRNKFYQRNEIIRLQKRYLNTKLFEISLPFQPSELWCSFDSLFLTDAKKIEFELNMQFLNDEDWGKEE